MEGYVIRVSIYLMSFMLCFYSLMSVRFDRFCNVKQPGKVQLLLVLSSMGLAYLVAEFILALIYYI